MTDDEAGSDSHFARRLKTVAAAYVLLSMIFAAFTPYFVLSYATDTVNRIAMILFPLHYFIIHHIWSLLPAWRKSRAWVRYVAPFSITPLSAWMLGVCLLSNIGLIYTAFMGTPFVENVTARAVAKKGIRKSCDYGVDAEAYPRILCISESTFESKYQRRFHLQLELRGLRSSMGALVVRVRDRNRISQVGAAASIRRLRPAVLSAGQCR